jgi:hypothetical protein
MGERRGFQRGFLSLYLQAWARSRVDVGGHDWASWAACWGGIVSQVQGIGKRCRWLAGSGAAQAFSEGLGAKRCAAGACRCTAVQGEGGVASAGRCRAGVRAERS